ncbi:MAG: lipid IV(A) 3-deoxy-D-manno-octulosonic acid transferase [Gallionella sp.]|nr:lipid IV(A) 3-deoxy-D-manno-octulosonic acid transferase [Gallionella sp.]
MVRLLYTLLLWLLLPLVFARLMLRARKQPEYLQHLGERFGFYPLPPSCRGRVGEGVIWLHAVSVGETRATVSLVAKLRAAYPDHQILLTHTTPTGRAASEQLYGKGVQRVYLPYDYPFAVRRFLRHFQPELGILMETELWFNLIHEGHTARVPMLLLNARLSEKSAKGYARFSRLTRNALQELDAIAAQTPDDAARLSGLGAVLPSVMGNLKFDVIAPRQMLELGKSLRQRFGTARRVFLAASTREGEEALLLDAWQAKDGMDGALLVIVPRHPQRFTEIAGMLARRGLRYQRRSANEEVTANVQVVLGDSMGEMFAYYAACDLAFIGGSLLPFGGQNLIEACSVGTPVLTGPHTYNFTEATRLAVEAGAAVQVNDAPQLMRSVQVLLNDAGARALMSKQGVQFVASHQGATDKAMEVIKTFLG